jgi:hypothetical protein
MTQTIVQINFTFEGTAAEYAETNLPAAPAIKEVPGVRWKIWLMRERDHEAGGIYLFESAAAAQTFVDGPLVSELRAMPTITNFSAKLFDILEQHTAITQGPVEVGAGA